MLELYKNMKWKNEKINRIDIEIPEDWEISKVKDIFDKISNGGTPNTKIKKYWEKGNINWVSVTELKNNYISKSSKKITNEGKISKNLFLWENNDILLSTGATIGKVCFIQNSKGITINQGITGLRTNKELSKYFYYLFNKKEINNLLKIYGNGTTFKSITLKILKNLQLHYPSSIEEQENIVKVLDEQEIRINNIDKQIDNYKDLLKYYQKELLSGNIRLKLKEEKLEELKNKQIINENNNILNIKSFNDIIILKDIELYKNTKWKNEKINRLNIDIPEDWEVIKLIDKLEYIKGKNIPEDLLNYEKKGMKYLKTTELCPESSAKRETLYFDKSIENKYIKQKDDYVFSLDGWNKPLNEFSTLGYMSDNNELGIISTGWYKILNKKNINKYLIVNYIKNYKFKQYFYQMGEGSTVKHAGKYLKNYEICYPKNNIEEKILNKFFQFYEQQLKTLKDLKELEEKKFKYLQSKLLSGEIRIKSIN